MLPPAWTLDVEMQFYRVAPILIAILTRTSLALKLLKAAGAILVGLMRVAGGQPADTPSLMLWVGIFLIGVIGSVENWKPKPLHVLLSIAVTLAVFVSIAVLPSTRPWMLLQGATGRPLTGYLPVFLTLGTILLSVPLAIGTTMIASSKSDQFWGDLSYPLYLFHWIPREWYYAHQIGKMPAIHVSVLLAINVIVSVFRAVIILICIDRPIQFVRTKWIKRKQNELVVT